MPDATDYVWDQYEESIKMSTYLLAFVISDFKYRVGIKTENQVQFRIWSRSEALEQTEYAADIGPKILQYYEDYFKVPFPLPKQVCRNTVEFFNHKGLLSGLKYSTLLNSGTIDILA